MAHLKRVFGFDAFRPGQGEVIEAAMRGEDVLAVMPTGSGKSLCFQLPAIADGGLTVVVSPLIALMEDQTRQLRELGVNALALNSSQSASANYATLDALRRGAALLVYMAPERLLLDDTLTLLAQSGVRRLVIDEAHCISQWGHDFRPEYLELSRAAEAVGPVQLLAFTATADEATRTEIVQKLFPARPTVFVRGFDRPNIFLAMAEKVTPKKQILEFVKARPGESGIVYTASRKDAEEYAELLVAAGVPALAYHAGMDKATRSANHLRFVREEGVVMTATVAFGMGIDKPDVRYVCHTALPKNIESYYQEIGRAGRDGLPAETLALYGLGDVALRRRQIMESEASQEQKRVETQRLNALLALCETPRCRRQTLLAYLGEESQACGNCDLCRSGCTVEDGTVPAQKAMSAAVRTGERFGVEHLVNVLMGAMTEKVVQCGHDRLPTFGVGAGESAKYWRALIRQIMASGLVVMDIVNHGRIAVTERGWRVLRGQEKVEVRARLIESKDERRARRAEARAEKKRGPGGELFAELKRVRLELAKQKSIPPYMIFSDKTLLEIESRMPETMGQFEEINGVGEFKLERYGRVFLDAVHAFRAGRAEPGDAPPSPAEQLETIRQIFRDCAAQATSWDELTTALAVHDLELRTRNDRLAIFSRATGEYLSRASKAGASHAKLSRKFGEPYPGLIGE